MVLVALACPGAAFAQEAAAQLRVIADVVAGPATAADFTVHVFSADGEVDSGPASADGTAFSLPPGIYRLGLSGPDGYVRAFTEACDSGGDVVLEEGADATCNLTLEHVPAFSDGSCLDYPHFAGAAGPNLPGDATIVGEVLQLNSEQGGVGAAWYGSRTPVADGFTRTSRSASHPPEAEPTAWRS